MRLHVSLRPAIAAIVAVALVLGSSCVIEPLHHWGEGVVTVRWSVDGGYDAQACYAHGARTAAVVFYDEAGDYYDETQVPCSSFATSASLPGGWYSATIDLLDGAGRPVSTTVDLGSFHLHDGDDVVLDAGFPFWSFY